MAEPGQIQAPNRPNLVSVGTIVWLSSELMFFAALFAMYFTVRQVTLPDAWPPEDVHLNIAFASLNTAVLVSSSLTCQLGVFAAERGDVKGLRKWFMITYLMGAFFVAGLDEAAIGQWNLSDDGLRATVDERIETVRTPGPDNPDADACPENAADQCGRSSNGRSRQQQLSVPSPSELVAISPRRHLRALRFANANQVESFPKPGKADVVRRDAQAAVAVSLLRELDRFPSLVQRREVPALTPCAHHPESASRGIEGQPSPDGKHLERLVAAEVNVAVNTGREHVG